MTTQDQNAHKRTKTRFELVPLGFVAAMARVMASGLKLPGRYPDSWKQLDPAEALPMYRASILRHLQAEEEAGPLSIDPDSNEPHLVHVAAGAMIAWWLARKAQGVADAEAAPVDPDALPKGWRWFDPMVGNCLRLLRSEREDDIAGRVWATGGYLVGAGSGMTNQAHEPTFASAQRALVAALRANGAMP